MNKAIKCNCGSLDFKIELSLGKIQYKCVQCGEIIEDNSYDEYENLSSICERCNSIVFTINIIEDERTVYCSVFCKKCGSEPKVYLADRTGEIINKNTKRLFVIMDVLKILKQKIDLIENKIDKLNYIEDALNFKLNIQDADIFDLISGIEECQSSINNLRWEIREMQIDR